MTPQTLSEIKKELAKFLTVVEAIANYWNAFPQYTLISVLVQNAAHDSSKCVDYNHDKAVEKLNNIVNLLRQLKTYSKSYFEEYVYNEVSMIVDGISMSKLQKDQDILEKEFI